jgi:hypothetical protein
MDKAKKPLKPSMQTPPRKRFKLNLECIIELETSAPIPAKKWEAHIMNMFRKLP